MEIDWQKQIPKRIPNSFDFFLKISRAFHPVYKALILKPWIPVRRNNGSKPSHWSPGSGTVARKALQSLEQMKLIEKDPNGGRRLSSQGRRDMDRIAAQIVAIGKK